MKLKCLAAAIALALGSTAANAAITRPNPGPGELFLTIYDTTAGNEASFNIGLNITTESFNGGGSYSFANIFSDPVFTANFDANNFATMSNWRWNVVGASFYEDASATVFTSVGVGPITNAAVSNVEANTGFYLTALGSCDSCGTNGNTADPRYAGAFWGSTMNEAGAFNTSAAVGAAVAFYFAQNDIAGSGYEETGIDAPTLTQFASSWTLSNTGTLTYGSQAPAVPVPAAVWLFGSGLLGLVGVGRRRSARAA